MKSKKKLLLMGVGVMGALAMGVGATSTFAWFTAQTVLGLSTAEYKSAQLTTTQTELSLGSYTLKFTIASISTVELSYKYTSAGTLQGRGTAVGANDVVVGGMVNGNAYEDIVYDADSGADQSASVARVIGTYTIEVTWAAQTANSNTEGTDPRTTDEKASMKGWTYTIDIGKEGNVVLLDSDNEPSTEATKHTATISFANADGSPLQSAVSVDHDAAFAIRTNAHDGAETDNHSGDKIVISAGSLTKA